MGERLFVRAFIRAAAERLHLTVDVIYTDARFSGSLGIEHRRGLADALNALRPGDTLLVAKPDRIARDAFLSVLVERAVLKKGARTLSCAGEGTESDDPTATFTRRILDAVSDLERALIAARTRSAMREAKKRGQRVGWIPYGKRLGDDGIHLEENPDEQASLSEVRRLRAKGYALITIAETLNAQGSRNRQGREWKPSFIGQLLDRHPAKIA